MSEKYFVFEQACIKMNNDFLKKLEKIIPSDIQYSLKYKMEINRINKEIIGSDVAIYPEVNDEK